jgi:hypothetical protein
VPLIALIFILFYLSLWWKPQLKRVRKWLGVRAKPYRSHSRRVSRGSNHLDVEMDSGRRVSTPG